MTARSLTSQQFKATFREGARGVGDHAVVYVRPNGLAERRIGVTVGRRFGNAVRRNRLRRRLREAVRTLEVTLPAGVDVVCAPRANAATASFPELTFSLRRALLDAGAMTGHG
ncbi:MAG TPA: ribonuclease P protein component [bacterium]